ncbi:MAG TPA: amidohydrolase family protein [Phycisphaerae bacterium]|nr:amidohydrolase family protein [Phycisphaerae bacterium]
MKRGLALLGIVLGMTGGAFAQGPRAFVGARVIPIEGPEIADGVLLIDGDRIVALGPRESTPLPAGAEQIDVSGKTIMPGLVDTHNHIGGIGGGDGSSPLQPGVRVYESLNVHDAGFRRAVAGGLTTLNIMPGSGHLSSGQTIYVKLRPARTIEDLAYRNADGSIAGGLKMANGTNSMRDAPFPGTRGKSAALVREEFIKAQEYVEKVKRAGDDPEKLPARDLDMECLAQVLSGDRIVHYHTHRHDDIMTILRLKEEFGFRVVLHHVSEGWRVADEIAASGTPCSVILVDSPGGKIEAEHLIMKTAAVLDKAGVLVAFHTDDWISDSRLFLRMAALGVRAGLPRDKALAALTLSGAKMLDLDNRVGSLKAGKDADFIVLSGDPFSVYTKVEQTWVEGNKVFDRTNPDDRLHAAGGYGAGDEMEPYLCCQEDAEAHQ